MYQPGFKKIGSAILIGILFLNLGFFNYILPDLNAWLFNINSGEEEGFENLNLGSAQAALDSSELEYFISIGPINGSTSSGYRYAAIFNPVGSGRSISIKQIAVRTTAVAGANSVNLSVRRISSSTSGTEITAANIPKKNASSSDPVAQIRHTNPTVTLSGATESRIMSQAMPRLANSFYSNRELILGASDEKIVLQEGEGITLYQEAAGDADQRIRLFLEWEETTATPSAQNEYLLAYPQIPQAGSGNYVYSSFFNPSGSGKVAIIKRVWFGPDTCDSTAVYTNNVAVRRITAVISGGTSIASTSIPKKNTSSNNTAMDIRHTGPSVTLDGAAESRIGLVTPCAVAGQPHGFMQIDLYSGDEKIILKENEGIAFITEAIGDANQLNRLFIEWQEVATASTPSSQGEYILAYPKISGVAPVNGTSLYTIFNPSGSGKTGIIKRIVINNDADAGATYLSTNFRRLSAASNGVQIASTSIPKKHSSSSNPVLEARYCGPACATALTTSYIGDADSDILVTNGPGAVGQSIGKNELVFKANEPIILKEGEGLGVYIDVLAGDINHHYKVLVEWQEVDSASTPSTRNQYVISVGPVNGNTGTSYNYASFFNPSTSGKTAIVKSLRLRIDTISTATDTPMQLRRISNSTGGVLIASTSIPKKHSSSSNSIIEVRRTNPTVTYIGSTDSKLISVGTAGAAGSLSAPSVQGYQEYEFGSEDLIIQPGEGFGLYHDTKAGDADFRVKMLVEWEEVSSGNTPSSAGNYFIAVGPVAGSLTSDYVYATVYNPVNSNKNYVFKRIEGLGDRVGTLVAPGFIPISIRRISTSSSGTLVTASDIPKRHSGTATSTAEIRHTGPTVSLSQDIYSRLLGITAPGVVNADRSREIAFTSADDLILKPGEGLALYQEAAAGDILMRYRFGMVWSESDISSGSLSVDIVDGSGVSVSSPSLALATTTMTLPYNTTSGNLGTTTQKIRVSNTTATPSWNMSIAANTGSSTLWSAGTPKYDFNDPTANGLDGGDSDSYGGQMSLTPTSGTITPQSGCNSTGLTLGSLASFSEGSVDNITLLTAGSSAGTNCYWDITDIPISQTIPPEQPVGSYSIDMTLSVVAS